MRIAQIAPVVERVPPKKYGGTERVVYVLTEELVKRGHDVTLFASRDSVTSAHLIATTTKSARELHKGRYYETQVRTLAHVGYAYRMQSEFDIIHDHCGINSLPLAVNAKTPVVMTLHGAFNKKNIHIYKTLNNPFNPHFVSVSRRQQDVLPNLNYAGTVYNGLNMENYPFSKKSSGYLLFVGRINREKGVHNAIAVAKRLKLPLIIAAKLDDINKDYFKKYVRPNLGSEIKWIGEVNEKERNILMSKALCFLHPVTWEEPFGLTLIESMATGCPVVAFNKGSIPEIVRHKKSGYVVETLDEMIAAVKNIKKISREYCRDYALDNFNASKMTSSYESLYTKILFEQYEARSILSQHNAQLTTLLAQ